MSETRRKIGAGMKVKIKSYNDEMPEYLTEGKEYSLSDFSGHGGWILDDIGDEIYILLEECAHLNVGSWEIVE